MTKRLTTSEFIKRVNQKCGNQFTVLSDYHDMHSKVKIRCNKCGWNGEMLAGNLLRHNCGSKCPNHEHRQFDSSSFQKAIDKKQDGQYALLSEYTGFKTKVKVRCNICKKEFYVWPKELLRQRMGKNCKHQYSNHRSKLNFEQASKRLDKISDGEIKLVNFSNMASLATFEHRKCGNVWKATANEVFNSSTGCPACSSSKGEKKVVEYLKENKILFKPQFTFPNCKDKRMLPFDFAVFNRDGSLNSLIEYQGCQHFMDLSQYKKKKKGLFSKKAILSVQKHDAMKLSFCQKHGIKLIYINHPQTTGESNKYSFIINLVKHTLDKELKVS